MSDKDKIYAGLLGNVITCKQAMTIKDARPETDNEP
jgi:hypothetical protein